MEWAVCTASSDSEDAMTQEMNEEERAPLNRDQQDSIYGAGEQSSTKEVHGSLELACIKKAASTRNGWDSRDLVKAEAGQKLADKGGQHLTRFEENQGIKLSAPYILGSTCTVNSSDGAGILDCEPENITMQMVREDEDEEQVLVTQEDLGESTEELEIDSSISKNGVSQKLNPGRSDVQRKKRNLTVDGQGQASKLVKRSEHPQENQLTYASTECGESPSGPSCSQWNKTFQSSHLVGNGAADEPVSCNESKEMLSHSSELVEYQEVRTGKRKYYCTYCHLKCRDAERLKRHLLVDHKSLHQCPDCIKCFKKADGLSEHRLRIHNVEQPFACTECNVTFNSLLLINEHRQKAHPTEKTFKCPECYKRFVRADNMSLHRLMVHNVEKPYQCTECNLTFNSLSLRSGHHHTPLATEKSVVS